MVPHIVIAYTDPVDDVYKKVGSLWNWIGGNILVDLDGESIGDPLPSGVAILGELLTDTSRVVGKKYVGGLSELAQTAGQWISTVSAAMLSSISEWMAQFQDLVDTTTYYVPGVYSTKALAFKPFTGAGVVRAIPAYQRRRKEGVGA